MSFPLSSIAIAALRTTAVFHSRFVDGHAWDLLVLAFGVIAWLAFHTVTCLAGGDL